MRLETFHLSQQRLSINGSRIFDDEGTEFIPRGFNFNAISVAVKENDGRYMRQLSNTSNLARIVGIPWGNVPFESQPSNKDCMAYTYPYIKETCLKDLDLSIRNSLSDDQVWAILTLRGEYVAGQNFESNPNENVFHNDTLRKMMYDMWKHVSNRYKTFDRIAAYEVLSEPRDKNVNQKTVTEFYRGACEAVQSSDPLTPCLIGPKPYYNIFEFENGEDLLLAQNSNVLYTFDFFMPQKWFEYDDVVKTYPGTYKCKDIYKGYVNHLNCPEGANSLISFDRDWFKSVLQGYVVKFRDTYNVPIFLNQFAVHYQVTEANGRYEYVRDLISVLHELDIGYAWWTFRGTGNGYLGPNNGWSNSSSDVVWFRNSDNRSGVDSKILNAMQDGALKRFDSVVNTTSGFIQGVQLENSKYVRRAYLGVPYVVFENINSHPSLTSQKRSYTDTRNLQNVGSEPILSFASLAFLLQTKQAKIVSERWFLALSYHICLSLVSRSIYMYPIIKRREIVVSWYIFTVVVSWRAPVPRFKADISVSAT